MSNENERARDDELLSAYLDDALSAADQASLERRLAADAVLAARLRELERADTAVRNAYAGVIAESLPREVLALLDTGARRSLRNTMVPYALAASIALAIGVVLGIDLSSRQPAGADVLANGGVIARATPLHAVLEGVPSALSREIGTNVIATPVLSFRTTNGAWCRQFEVRAPAAQGEGVACREGADWRIAAFAAAPGRGEGGFSPAAGGAQLIDDAVDAAIDGEPLAAQAEAALIAGGWQ